MSIRPRVPNVRLRALLTEAGWTGAGLARVVNAVAAESGLRLNYKRASTAQWLSGRCPRAPVPELVAETLTRALQRPITPAEAGFPDGNRVAQEGEGTVAEQLIRLGGRHSRRDALRYSVYHLTLLALPGFDHTASLLPLRPSAIVGEPEVAAATTALRLFSDADKTLGAGMVRAVLADYLAHTISPWLRTGATSADTHRELLRAAAELAYLCGFMCFDDNAHGVAQRYYRSALRLAAEAGDRTRYAITLRAMSVQAWSLAHHDHALRLAQAAVEAAGPRPPLQMKAFLFGQVAVAAAAVGDSGHAAASLSTAERALAGPGHEPAPIGAYHHGSLAHQRAAVAACLGDKTGAINALRESVRLRPPGEYRSQAIILARLAEVHLDRGKIDEAVTTWHRYLDIYPTVRSARVSASMAILRARLRPHQNIAAVRALSSRAAALWTP